MTFTRSKTSLVSEYLQVTWFGKQAFPLFNCCHIQYQSVQFCQAFVGP